MNRAVQDLEGTKRNKRLLKSFFQEENVLFAAA